MQAEEEDEYTPEELQEMLDEAKPASMVKLFPTEDWIVTAWCASCGIYHHHLVAKAKRKRKKPYDAFELVPPMKMTEDGGLARHKGKFESVDHVEEYIDSLNDDEDEEEDD